MAEKIRLDRKCPVCSEGIGNLLGEVRFALYKDCPLQNCVPLVCCEKCGAVFYNTKSTEEDFSEYYENYLYYNQSQSRGMGGLSDSDRVRFAEVVRILEKNKVPKEGKIVDVGCAKGGLLRLFAEAGYSNLCGVDPLAANVELANSEAIVCKQGSGSSIPLEANSCDAILFSHTFEHILDFEKTFAEIERVAKSDAMVYVEVPDASHYPTYLEAPLWDMHHEHINHWDGASLNNLFAMRGFRTVETGSKPLDLGNGSVTCLYGLYRRTPKPASSLTPDFALAEVLSRSFDQSPPISEFLSQANATEMPVHVWGLSSYAFVLLGTYLFPHCNVAGLYDGNSFKQTLTIQGHAIQTPDNLQKLGKDDAIIIATSPFQEEMKQILREANFPGSIFIL